MLTADQITSIFQCEGIGTYETSFCFDEDIDIALKSDNAQDFICLLKENGIKSVFYCYKYVNKEDYLINDDDMADIDTYANGRELIFDEYERYFEVEKIKFNRHLELIDFSKPVALSVYCILNGIQVGIVQNNFWNDRLPDKEAVLSRLEEQLEEMYESAIAEEHAENEAKCKDIYKMIIDYLDSTDEWHSCTNQRLRRNYCDRLVDEYSKKYSVSLYVYEIIDALEMRWNGYKANKSRQECRKA